MKPKKVRREKRKKYNKKRRDSPCSVGSGNISRCGYCLSKAGRTRLRTLQGSTISNCHIPNQYRKVFLKPEPDDPLHGQPDLGPN